MFYRSNNGDFALLQGDCVAVTDELGEGVFDMIFADPPYFLSNGGISCRSGKVVCVDKGEWDKGGTSETVDAFNLRWLSACRKALKDAGTIWISGTQHNIFSVANALPRLGYRILNVIVWQKTNPPPCISCKTFKYSAEYVIWARKHEKKPHYFDYGLMKRINANKQMTDVWTLPAVSRWEQTCGKHPTQKPLSLLARIILASTMRGGLVLDPFAGSCTTGIAANLLGRRFVGIDKEDEYLVLGRARREELEDGNKRDEYLTKMERQAPLGAGLALYGLAH